MAKKGPGGKEVGRVSVRVVPDTSGFAQELRAKLKQIEKQVKMSVPVDVDVKSATKSIARVQSSLSNLDFGKAMNFDLSRSETILGNVVASMHNAGAKTREIAKNVSRTARKLVDVRNHWNNIGAGITAAAKGIRNVNVTGFYRTMLRSAKSVTALTGRIGTFAVETKRAFVGVAGRASRGVSDALSAVGSAANAVVPAFGNISRTGWIMIAVFTLAAPVIGLVATLLAALPSLAFIAGGAIAAIALGFDGIKKAAKQLSPQVDQLKKSLSATFEKGLTPVFKQLGKVFPVLEKGLNNVAKGLIPMVQAFTDVVTSAKGMAQIQSILDNTGKFLAAIAPTVRDGMSAFLTLADAGAKSFVHLARVLNTFSAEFRSMVERVTSNGVFDNAIKALAQVTGALLHVFVQLFESGLKVMAQIGGPLSGLIAALGNALVALMPALGAITNLFAVALTPVLNALVPILNALMPAFTALSSALGASLAKTIQAVTPVLVDLAVALNDFLLKALKAIEPFIEPMNKLLGDLAKTIGNFLVGALRALQPYLQQAADFFGRMFQAVQPMVPQMQELAKAVGEQLLPVFQALGKFFGQVFEAIKPLLPKLMELARVVFKALIDILVALWPHLVKIAQVALPLLMDVIRALAPMLGKIIDALIQIIPPLAKLIGFIIDVVAPVFIFLLQVIQEIWPQISGIIEGALDIILGIIKVFVGLLTGDWRLAWDGLKQVFSGAWNAIKNAVELAIKGLLAIFVELPKKILGALGDLGNLLYEVGKAIIGGLLRGMKNAAGGMFDFVRGIGPNILKLKGPMPYDKRLLIPPGKWIMEGLHKGLKDNFVPVQKLVAGMGGKLANSFDGQSIGASWARSVDEGTPAAIRAVEGMMTAASQTASAEWNGHLSSDDFGSVGDQVQEALSGWQVVIDANGIAKLVNKSNTKKARRG